MKVGGQRHAAKLPPAYARTGHRGLGADGFIRSVDDAVHRFYASVVVHLDRPAPRRAPSAERTVTAVG
ncbi:hypothetical protein [Streptomyces europaeiscabiei]|uniref:hypothetical protein n=1 Tax=Streptomyces europaeiscabiei TaxID=146819 RepID=UPI002E285E20|nr:hypothetical protein [Streptomyces europaeiscabiei]